MEMEPKRHRAPSPVPSTATAVSSVLGDDDLVAEILLRLDSPTWLVRAALVSTRWLRRASDPVVLRRFRALHPPRILALYLNVRPGPLPVPGPPELAAATRRAIRALACHNVHDSRSGRLLITVDRRDVTAYAVRSLLRPARDKYFPPHPHSISCPSSLLVSVPGLGRFHGHFLFLLGDDGDDTSCVSLFLHHNGVKFCAQFSVLQSGVWGVAQSLVTELRQDPLNTIEAHKLLVGSKFYMKTTLGYVLGLDLVTASFFTVQLPDEARDSTTMKFSRGQHSSLYIIDAKGFQLRVWHGDGAGQWVLVDTISVCDVCCHLNVQRWVPYDGDSAPVKVVAVGDNAEFVILELVASGIVCCMQLGNRAVEKVSEGVVMHNNFVLPITMVWPPISPVLDKASQE